MEQNQNSVEATIESSVQGNGGTESTCNNNNNNNSNNSNNAVNSKSEREKALELADELMARGSKASKEGDYGEAVECYSRALELRATHFGELAPECVNTYYKYGCALLYKAQEEADPLGAVPKKERESQQNSNIDGSVKSAVNGEPSVSSNAEQVGSSNNQEKAPDAIPEDEDQEEDEHEDDAGDVAGADEDEDDEDDSDLDLAWKMLDVARAIAEKHSGDTMEKVDVLSALAEVALEREDVETSLSDYLKALSILERLVEPDSRHIAELNFRICLCLETGSKPQEAIPHCQKAIAVCKSRVQRLTEEVKSLSGSTATSAASELDQAAQQSSSSSQSVDSIADKEAEIETLTGLASELEKKLEDLQQLVANPSSILTDILAMVTAHARVGEKSDVSVAPGSSQMGTASSSGGIESPTVSTAHTNGTVGVTHLGVVGRGVKRVNMKPETPEQGLAKKPSLDPSLNSGDGSAS